MFDAIRKHDKLDDYARGVMTVRPMAAMIRNLRQFFEQSMGELAPWNKVSITRAETSIVEARFKIGQEDYLIRIRPPAEDPIDRRPLGEVALLGDADFAGPIDAATWNHIAGVLKRRHPEGPPKPLQPWRDSYVRTA